uniref:Uncharacterized protein n=1 Tax=viral metagenome TaxID=1070528 RepID=A0A6C0EA93_9ZZZZ
MASSLSDYAIYASSIAGKRKQISDKSSLISFQYGDDTFFTVECTNDIVSVTKEDKIKDDPEAKIIMITKFFVEQTLEVYQYIIDNNYNDMYKQKCSALLVYCENSWQWHDFHYSAYLMDIDMNKAEEHVQRYINTNFSVLAYYNLACIYSIRNVKDIALEKLRLSIDAGFKDWLWMICDDDLANVKYTDEFVDIIVNCINSSSVNDDIERWLLYIELTDKIVDYIVKTGLDEKIECDDVKGSCDHPEFEKLRQFRIFGCGIER